MAIAGSIKLTADQYLALGEDPPGVRLELINGEIFVSPSPTFNHGVIVSRLSRILGNHIVEHNLGELVMDIDTIFDNENVLRPDIIFISKPRLKKRSGIHINVSPDLCVEVISPSSVTKDQSEKFELFEKNGVAHYWIIDPRTRSIDCHALKKGKYKLAAKGAGNATVQLPPFPDLKINLADLWP